MGTMKPWSYSSLTAFESCPRKYNIVRNLKEVVEPTGEAQRWGSWVHEQLEVHLRDGVPLPASLTYLQPLLDKINAWTGTPLVEHQMAVSGSFEPAVWDNCWARGIVDYAKVKPNKAVMLDWKTGKRKTDSDQLKLFAAFGFTHYPSVDKITTGFVWLKENKLDTEVFTRSQLPGIWQEFIGRAKRLQLAFENDRWPANPSGLCRAWCAVGRARCEFCGTN